MNQTRNPRWRERLAKPDQELLHRWEERAAIRELDGGQERAEAEAAAYLELMDNHLTEAQAQRLAQLGKLFQDQEGSPAR